MRAAALLLMLLLPADAEAANWMRAAQGGNGTVAEFDQDTFRVAGDEVTAWIAYDFSRDRTERARSAKSRVKVNCASWSSKTLSMIRYAADGSVMQDTKSPFASFEEIIPESLGDELAQSLCDYRKLRAKLLHE